MGTCSDGMSVTGCHQFVNLVVKFFSSRQSHYIQAPLCGFLFVFGFVFSLPFTLRFFIPSSEILYGSPGGCTM